MTISPLRGIGLMVAATVCFSLSDTMAKDLVRTVPAVEIAWIRYVVFTLMALAPALRPGSTVLRTRRPWLQALRGIGILLSSITFIMALRSLPLAEAAAVTFASPLFITLLAVPLLGEVVGTAGWLAVLSGFAGVLIVIRPGTGGFHPAALLVLLSAIAWAVSMIITRRTTSTERPTVTLFWTAATGLVLLTAMLPFAAEPMTAGQIGLSILLGFVASSGHGLAVLAYRHAAASVLAPLSYGQLIWSSLFGWIAFGAVPDRWTLVGGLVIAGSGMAVIGAARRRPGSA